MPRLMALLAARRVVFDQGSNNATVVDIVEQVTTEPISDLPDEVPVENAGLGEFEWTIFLILGRAPEDTTNTYDVRFDQVAANGRRLPVAKVVRVTFGPGNVRIRASSRVMLVESPGLLECEAYVRAIADNGDAGEWMKIGSYPIEIRHSVQSSKPGD